MIDLNKFLEIWISRKDKFKKADERANRRNDYFNEIKKIDSDTDLDEDQKRVLKDSAAQKLTGSSLVTHQFVSYFHRNNYSSNFEIIAATVAFWGSCISIYDLEDGYITRIEINNFNYWCNLFMCFITCSGLGVLLFFLVLNGGEVVNFLSTNYHISATIFGALYLGLVLLIFCISVFFFYLYTTLLEVKSSVNNSL